MGSSLEKLVSYMDTDALRQMKTSYPDPDQFALLTRKGVFPYDHLTDWDKLKETVLPSKDAFYSKLTDSHISDDVTSTRKKYGTYSKFQIWASICNFI